MAFEKLKKHSKLLANSASQKTALADKYIVLEDRTKECLEYFPLPVTPSTTR